MHSPCRLHVLGSLSPPRLLLGSGTGVANTHGWQSPAPGGELMSCLDLGGLSRPVASPWQPRPSLQVRIIEVFTTHTAAKCLGTLVGKQSWWSCPRAPCAQEEIDVSCLLSQCHRCQPHRPHPGGTTWARGHPSSEGTVALSLSHKAREMLHKAG